MGIENPDINKVEKPEFKKTKVVTFKFKEGVSLKKKEVPDKEKFRRLGIKNSIVHPILVNDSYDLLCQYDLVKVSLSPDVDDMDMTILEHLASFTTTYEDYYNARSRVLRKNKINEMESTKSNQEILFDLHSQVVLKRYQEKEYLLEKYNKLSLDKDNNSIESRDHDGPIFVRGINELDMIGLHAESATDQEDLFDKIDEFIIIEPNSLKSGNLEDFNANETVYIGIQRSADPDRDKKEDTTNNPIDYIPDRLEFGNVPRFFLKDKPSDYGRDDVTGDHMARARVWSDKTKPLKRTMGSVKYNAWMKNVFTTGVTEFNDYLENSDIELTDKEHQNIKKARDVLILVLENLDK